MAKKNQIKFKYFIKGLELIASKNFYNYNLIQKRGSGIRLELFKEKGDKIPCAMNVFHEDTYVHKGDLEKACKSLGINAEYFLKIIDEM